MTNFGFEKSSEIWNQQYFFPFSQQTNSTIEALEKDVKYDQSKQ